ncbi:MAG: tetratricopeptide repeat protein [Spirochaetia bacterium]
MRITLALAVFLCTSLAVFAQDAAQFTAETTHYSISSEVSQAQADDVSHRMEAALALYNDVFHFDLSLLPAKLRIRVFKNLDSFNAYLQNTLSQTRTDFVFVAWSDPARSELLAFPKDEPAFTASLLHQGCIQFIKAFVENPPVWLREGMATYLDASVWDPSAGTFAFKPNLGWLEGLKSLVRGETPARLISFPDLLTISRESAQSQMDVFAPESWGLVQFLLGSADRSYSRALWDSIAALGPKATLDDNSQRARKRAFSWITDQKLQADFTTYILSMKTATDLVKDGIDQYTKGDMAGAEASFTKSLDLDASSGTAFYYLGLVAYSRKDYARAEDMYLKAFQLGANAGTINYALGVNSFAARKNAEAAKYLNFAKQADKTTYGDKVDALLKRIAASN